MKTPVFVVFCGSEIEAIFGNVDDAERYMIESCGDYPLRWLRIQQFASIEQFLEDCELSA